MDLRKEIALCKVCNRPPTYYCFTRLKYPKEHLIKCRDCKISYSSSNFEETVSNWNNTYGVVDYEIPILCRCRKCKNRPELDITVNKDMGYGYIIKGCNCFPNMKIAHKSRALIINKWNTKYGA